MSTKVVLVDSGGSNLGSVQAAFSRLGVCAPVSSDWEEIQSATHVVLPGVGAAGSSMQRLQKHGLVDKLPSLKQPVLGVCVGIQLMFAHSEESDTRCLGLFPGRVQRLVGAPGLRIPHMGWNQLNVHGDHPLTAGLDGKFAYFVHSFAAASQPAPDGITVASCDHGSCFSAVVARGNFMGAQFHPERSQAVGARLLKNFLEIR